MPNGLIRTKLKFLSGDIMVGNDRKKKGFTLIELLVVIAIIALLLSIVMPGLNLAKKKASSIVCMANVKNLSLGWFSYKEDNNGRIMSSEMDGFKINNIRIPGQYHPVQPFFA